MTDRFSFVHLHVLHFRNIFLSTNLPNVSRWTQGWRKDLPYGEGASSPTVVGNNSMPRQRRHVKIPRASRTEKSCPFLSIVWKFWGRFKKKWKNFGKFWPFGKRWKILGSFFKRFWKFSRNFGPFGKSLKIFECFLRNWKILKIFCVFEKKLNFGVFFKEILKIFGFSKVNWKIQGLQWKICPFY